MSLSRLFLFVFLSVALAVAGVAGQSLGQAGPSKVLILPFNINAPQDMTYLQQGIMDMLGSRLSWEDKVMVLPAAQARQAFEQVQGRVDEQTARELGRNLGADYILFGSVTVLGQNISLDARLLDFKQARPAVSVFTQAERLDGVIPKVNQFAEEINVKVFGREASVKEARPKPQPEEPVPAYRRHPDYLLTGMAGQSVSPINPNFLAAPGSDTEGGFWRSPSFPLAIVGLDVGDVDGDGRNEIVYASQNTVFVARIENDVFQRLVKYDGIVNDRFLTVDIADINGNGVPEIFISNQRRFEAKSLVLEFKGGRLVPLVKDAPWYYRVVDLPEGRTLLGQRGGMGDLFHGNIHRMKFSGGDYVPQAPFNLPEGINIFNFTLAELGESGKDHLIVINKDEHLVVMSRSGQQIWKSREYFNGTYNYLSSPTGGMENLDFYPKNTAPIRDYIPSRILVVDLNEDGKKEIIVANNEASHSRLMERWRGFDRGSIISLSFNQMSMRENWRSRPLPGALSDYHIADYNNNGRKDLIVAVITAAGEGILESRSTIAGYELASPEELRKVEAEQEK